MYTVLFPTARRTLAVMLIRARRVSRINGFGTWWDNVRERREWGGGVWSVSPEVSAFLANPSAPVTVNEDDGFRLMEEACKVPGWPSVTDDLEMPLEFVRPGDPGWPESGDLSDPDATS